MFKKVFNNGYVLIALAALLLWIGGEMRRPLLVHHKILVASPSITGDIFDHAVIFIVNHNMMGAFGIILNKPSGGPVEPKRFFALHSPDVVVPGSIVMGDIDLAFIEDAQGINSLKALDIKPAWHLIASGYAGWKPRQLDREIRRRNWKVIDYDPKIIKETAPKIMWETANKRPDSHL